MTARGSRQRPALFRIREPEVRSLCRGAAFGQGDTWQRTGHVMHPVAELDALSAEVRGTWRHVERVRAEADAKGIHTTCSCGGENCRHAAALLLHWIRAPESFRDAASEFDTELVPFEHAPAISRDLFERDAPNDELVELLETRTMSELRDLARRRGLRTGGRNKGELADTLAVGLADSENIDASLVTLTADERALLLAIDLMGDEATSAGNVATAYRLLAGPEQSTEFQPALEVLVNLGLTFVGGDRNRFGDLYVVPSVVSARLSFSDSILHQLVRAAEWTGSEVVPDAPSGLGFEEVLLAVLHDLVRGAIGREVPAVPKGSTIVASSGWMTERPPRPSANGLFGRPQSFDVTLTPQPSYLSSADKHQVATRTGASADMIDLAVEMLVELDIVTVVADGEGPRYVVREQHVHDVMKLPALERAALLIELWLDLFEAFDFRATNLQLHTQQLPYYAPLAVSEPHSGAIRDLMTRLLARLVTSEPQPRWYSLPEWLDLLWELAPRLLGTSTSTVGVWWFVPSPISDVHLDLGTREGWQGVWEPLVTSMLRGPLTWLGLVETSRQADGTLCFRSRFATAPAPVPLLSVALDRESGTPEILVPARYPEPSIHPFLQTMAELADISPSGFRYRITRRLAQEAFERGVTGPDIIGVLSDSTDGHIPDDARAVVAAWWTGYGSVRLYDDLTLVELGDDILLHELLATSSLPGALVKVVTPRLVAVEPGAVRTLLGEMERLGYTPRILEGA